MTNEQLEKIIIVERLTQATPRGKVNFMRLTFKSTYVCPESTSEDKARKYFAGLLRKDLTNTEYVDFEKQMYEDSRRIDEDIFEK